jgi:hypothetical protein
MSAALSQSPMFEQVPAPVAADQLFTLRRSGARPMTFAGAELCSAMSYEPGTPMWYEINIYRTAARSYVANVKMFSKSEDEKDRFAAYEAENFDEVLAWLETYEPANDIRISLPFDDPQTPMVELGIRAAAASMKVAEARRQYRDLMGEVFFALERN